MVYAEHVGMKRQLGGKRGEMQYWYPRTNPMNRALQKLPTIMSCIVGRAPGGSKRCYRHANILGIDTGEAGPDGQNAIRSRRILFRPESERLPDNSFEAVSLHCATNLAMNTDPQPAPARGIFPADKGKTFTGQTSPAVVDVIELPPFAQESTFGQTFPGQRLRRESLPAFRPPGREHRPAPAGAHSFTKTVHMFTLEIAWLKSSLAHSFLPRLEKSMGKPMFLLSEEARIDVSESAASGARFSSGRHMASPQDDKLQTININHT